MRRIALDINVNEAARQRIRWVFDTFPKVCVSFSAGKDSSVMLHLVMEEARRRGRTVAVLLIDLEAQYACTMDHAEDVFAEYEPRWVCWDPEARGAWVREPPAVAITDPDQVSTADQDARAAAIESAVGHLNAESIYKADETCERYIVTDDAMVKLGRMLAAKTPDVYAEWCHVSAIIEVDVEGIVHDSSIDEDTDLDALQAEAGAADDMATFMMLEFHREEIEIEAARVAHDRREDDR